MPARASRGCFHVAPARREGNTDRGRVEDNEGEADNDG